MRFREIMDVVGTAVDTAGVSVIVIGAIIATTRFLFQRRGETTILFRLYRQDMGRAILLGLEFLVAGDIIRTVVVDPTFDNVIVLGLIVLIRTFLSMSLQLELDGRWPWRVHCERKRRMMSKKPSAAQISEAGSAVWMRAAQRRLADWPKRDYCYAHRQRQPIACDAH